MKSSNTYRSVTTGLDMFVTLAMVTFKPIGSPDHARRFLGVLERAGGIYIPDFLGDDRTSYAQHNLRQLDSAWASGVPVSLGRENPVVVTLTQVVQRGDTKTNPPSYCHLTVDMSHFATKGELEELLGLGNDLYDFFSPCYGFVRLSWMPELQATALPVRGLPGWGWATWLGPEYDDLVRLRPSHDLAVQPMPDGGRLFLLPYPEQPAVADSHCLEAHRRVILDIDHRLFQQRVQESLAAPEGRLAGELGELSRERRTSGGEAAGVLVPRFRFRES